MFKDAKLCPHVKLVFVAWDFEEVVYNLALSWTKSTKPPTLNIEILDN